MNSEKGKHVLLSLFVFFCLSGQPFPILSDTRRRKDKQVRRKIDKAKVTYNYSGAPKSYWHFVEKKALRWISPTQKQSPEARTKALERLKKIDATFAAIKKKRRHR